MSRTFGQTLSLRRTWLGWSMAETATRLNVQIETYRSWENSRHAPHELMQRGVLDTLDEMAVARAHEILAELSTGNIHGCSPYCPHGERGPIDANTRSEGHR